MQIEDIDDDVITKIHGPKVSKGRSESPLVAPEGAKFLPL